VGGERPGSVITGKFTAGIPGDLEKFRSMWWDWIVASVLRTADNDRPACLSRQSFGFRKLCVLTLSNMSMRKHDNAIENHNIHELEFRRCHRGMHSTVAACFMRPH